MVWVIHAYRMRRDASLRWVGRGVRAAVLVMIFAACCYTASVYGVLWAEWRQVKRTPGLQPTSVAGIDAAGILPLAGHWSFADLDWELRSSHGGVADVVRRFACLRESIASETAAALPDASQELLELVANLKLKPIDRGGMRVYCVEEPGLKAQVTLCMVAGQPKLATMGVAIPHGDDQWQLFELRPRTENTTTKTGGFLLPLPSPARRSGARQTDDGRPLLELVSLRTTADELVSHWKKAGWEVRPGDFGNGHDFSFLCARGDEVVYAWSSDPQDELRNLMLVDAAASANTRR